MSIKSRSESTPRGARERRLDASAHTFVRERQEYLRVTEGPRKDSDWGVSVLQVMIDGPFGGSSVYLGQYETTLLLSGGSGIMFTLDLLDDIVGRCLKLRCRSGKRTLEFVWYTRSFGTIHWFVPMLTDIANTTLDSSIDLHISTFITCVSTPFIPNCDVIVKKPSINELLHDLAGPLTRSSTIGYSGGVAVCAGGPASSTREVQNAIAQLGIVRGIQLEWLSMWNSLRFGI